MWGLFIFMFDFTKTISADKLNVKWILSKVSDHQIFAYYFGPFKIGPAYTSKLRRDKIPSVGFFIGKSGELVYRDFASKEAFNCIQYVQKLYNCDFKTALTTIASDFGLLGEEAKVTKEFLKETENFVREERRMKFIQVRPKAWDKAALKWWNYYEISQKELEDNRVYNVDICYVDYKKIPNPQNFPRFAYYVPYVDDQGKDQEGWKIYNPCDPQHKWINSIPIYIPYGLDQLKFQSDTLWITKSQKDRIELLKIFPDVIATQNESEEALPVELQEYIFTKFKNAIVCYGADDQGVEACKKFNAKGFGYFNTPRNEYDKYGIEDPADYIRFYGIDSFKDLLKQKNFL